MAKIFDVPNSVAFRRLREVENDAREIFANSPLFVPGPLQEPDYAQEVICGFSGLPATDAEVVGRVEVRRARHAAFLERLESDAAPQVHVVLDESVLRRGVAGPVKRRQIEHLIELSRKPTVHIGVIPLEHGQHEGLAGPFEVHDLADDSLVFFEGAEGDSVLEGDPDRVALYREMVGRLMSVAATGEDARTLMAKLINV